MDSKKTKNIIKSILKNKGGITTLIFMEKNMEIRARPKRSYFYIQNQGEINMGAVLAFVAGAIVGIWAMCLLQINR